MRKTPTSLDQATFDALISGVLRYKCWAYLMLAKIYGEAVWIDDPLIEYQDISKYPTLGFKEVIGNCINLIEKGIVITDFRGEEHVISGKMRVRWTEILNNTDLVWNRYCPPAEALLTELYLFDEQYDNAIQSGFAMLRIGAEDSQTKPSFQITKTEWKGEWLSLFGSFTRTEAIFIIQYDYDQKQTNHLMEYFSNDPANKYYLKPTQVTIDRYKNETGDDGSAGDKYRGFSNDGVNGKTVKMENGEWVVWKYTAARSSADKIYRNDAPITLYRAPDIHLWLAEALVYKGRLEEAVVAFYDGGIESYYDKESGMFTGKFSDFPATLYSSSSDGSCMGIRGRAGLLKKGGDIIKNPSANIEDDQRKIINLLIEETCMESAGEARALYAMLRAAKRWNDPSFVADKVSAKYPDGKKQEMKNKLQNSENWFIKYNLK
ncbi:MAG: hypothetical protein ACLVKO_09950 [Dysgonomonas sp.]